MKTAVLFTGALRTVKKTVRYLKENVLIHPDVHVFACLQNDSTQSEAEWNQWFAEELGDHIQSITWFSDVYYPSWVLEREIMLRHMPLEDGWKNYLRNSGSMVEYKQLQLAYMAMTNHEQVHYYQYEYVIRARTDTIFAKKIDFRWLHFSEEQIIKRFDIIYKKLLAEHLDSSYPSLFSHFMSTLLSDDLIPNLKNLLIKYLPSQEATRKSLPSPKEMCDYLRNGRYILTVRKNLLYVVRRSLFHTIPSLASLYGTFRSPHSDHHWFNAECQFQGACYHTGLSSHEYSSAFEELPIAERENWKKSDYFDDHFNCIHPHMLYCLVRT
jgi:hypothetical protein